MVWLRPRDATGPSEGRGHADHPRASDVRALVIGASGAVGSVVAATLRGWGHKVTPAGRHAPQDGIALDLNADDLEPFRRAAQEHDVVVNASGVENPSVGGATGSAAFIDVSATGPYLVALAGQAPGASMVLGAGLAPGLSTVLVSTVRSRPDDALDVTIMLGSGEKHGVAAMAWTTRLVGTEIADSCDVGGARNFREHRWFAEPGGRRRYLRADFPDHTLVGHARGLQVRSWLALSSPVATRALGVVGRLPWARDLVTHTPTFGGQDWAVAVVNRRTGETARATGVGQSRATGLVTALAATAVLKTRPGQPVTLDALIDVTDLARLPGVDLTV